VSSEIWLAITLAGAVVLAAPVLAFAQAASGTMPNGVLIGKVDHKIPGGTVVIPESSIPKGPGRAHTPLEVVIPNKPLIPFDCDSSVICPGHSGANPIK
jgi:hypothetical protein